MDSRLIAGAYSQHFRALEKEEHEDSERSDSIARAKKLSQETNKRRKNQAQKRKLEAKREEQRRREILTKRREEQKQATEKYQRSHVPTGLRQTSGRLSPQRYTAPCLEDALQLIRRSPRRERPSSGRERVLSPKNENDDPLERSYFNRPRHHSARPSSGRSSHLLNHEARAELMDHSLKNLTSSKSLFEQQLEQQQNLLLQKQQQSLREFSDAVRREVETEYAIENEENGVEIEKNERALSLSDSCSSVDSLERSHKGERPNILQEENIAGSNLERRIENAEMNNDNSIHRQTFYLNTNLSDRHTDGNLSGPTHIPLNQDMTPSAIFQCENAVNSEQNSHANMNNIKGNGATKAVLLDQESSSIQRNFKTPSKQSSSDPLEESGSTSSVISLIRIPESNNNKSKTTDSDAISNFKSDLSFQGNDTRQQNSFEKKVSFTKGLNGQASGISIGQTALEQQSNGFGANDRNMFSANAGRNEPVIESYNPRYSSAIGTSIWPGHNPLPSSNYNPTSAGDSISYNNHINNSSPYGKRTSSVSLSQASTNNVENHIANHNSNKNENQSNTLQVASNSPSAMPVCPSVMSTKPFVPDRDNNMVMLNSFKKQDFIYPLPQQNSVQNVSPQNHTLLPSSQGNHSTNAYNTLQQEIKQLSDKMLENHMVSASQRPQSGSNILHTTATTTAALAATTAEVSSLHQEQDRIQMIHHIPHANDFISGPVPVPAVRTIFPTNKPPVPTSMITTTTTTATQQSQLSSYNQLHDRSKPTIDEMKKVQDSTKILTNHKPGESTQVENDSGVEEGIENTKALKGILKQLPPKVQGHQKGSIQARDSLELAKMQNEKKVKKKSVRFAAFVEENEEEYSAEDLSRTQMAGTNSFRQAVNRPASAKTVSQSSQSVTPSSKPVRSASAGSIRQPVSLVPQSSSALTESSTKSGQNNGCHLNSTVHKSNLPPQFSQPLNTTLPINRPKAAAHIIMSSESQSPIQKDGNGSTVGVASSLHKSQLEMKVKTVNNNFMSKVPVKINTSNAEVYHVINPTIVSIAQNEHSQQRDVQSQQQTERSRIRDNNASSKRVPLSNSTVTRTSIVAASTKINYPISNTSGPSYSPYTNTQGAMQPSLDENKVRLDKTPTDEEISWLWDKVRNCLDKEGENKGEIKQQNNSLEQPARQTPVLSTKIIDGTSLGLNTNGAPALRPGSGYFYTRNGSNTSTNGQNKIKPAVQQQGSYLRRYGLLQQRRVNSASGTPSNAIAIQARAGSAGLMRYPGMQGTQQTEGPKSIAFSYKPQDNVSESTAAFVMAERLAKQSLTDSHIAAAMEDAQNKQETYNKSRMGQKVTAPSALSIEEQRLMESLDKLNERLNATEQKSYSGTIHYHQPYQPHLPGFRGHQGLTHSRQPVSPRGQPRSQSARIRRQIRQYR